LPADKGNRIFTDTPVKHLPALPAKFLISKLRDPMPKRIPVYLVGSSQYHKSLLLRIDLALSDFAKTVKEEMGINSIDGRFFF
jgi:hypothetical protein